MPKTFFFLALCALGGLALWQNSQLQVLNHELDKQEIQLVGLKEGFQDSQASLILLYRFSLANHKNILSLKMKKTVTVTAYSAREEESDSSPWITASNNRVRPGIVAVSRDLFDAGWVFGRQVYVKNYGIYTIEDLMHERKTNQIDIYMKSTQAALNFGRQELDVYLLETPAPYVQEEALLRPVTNVAYMTGTDLQGESKQ